MEIEFTKMHGAGNDYIYVNTLRYPIDNPEELSVEFIQTKILSQLDFLLY